MENNFEKEKKLASEVKLEWDRAVGYMGQIGMTTQIPISVNFYEGKHWRDTASKSAFEYRPVITMIEMIVESKKATLLADEIAFTFYGTGSNQATEKVTKFAKYQFAQMHIDETHDKAVLDALVKRCGVYHFYWDNHDKEMCVENIDPLCFAVHNPSETNVQKQRWIIIKTRVEVKRARSLCENKELAKKIESSRMDTNHYGTVEQNQESMCTVYVKYFRKDGEVYFQRFTDEYALHAPKPLNPNISKKLIMEQVKEELNLTGEVDFFNEDFAPSSINATKKNVKANLYPIEVLVLKKKDKCIYGRSFVETITPNQRAINQQISAVLLNSQTIARGKILAKPNALNGQTITTDPGQVLIDYTPQGEWGIRLLESQQLSNDNISLADKILELTRSTTHTSEVLTGEMINSNISGSAIATAKSVADLPNSDMFKSRLRSVRNICEIALMFYRLYYKDKKFSSEIAQKTLQEGMKASEGDVGLVTKYEDNTFSGDEFDDVTFNIQVRAGKGSTFSEPMRVEMLISLFLNGGIEKMNAERFKQFITLMPDEYFDKEQLFALQKEMERGEIALLQSQLQQMQSIIQQQQQKLLVEQETNKALNNEFTQKVNLYNETLGRMEKQFKAQSNKTQANSGKTAQ